MDEKEIIRLLKVRDQRGLEELLLHFGPLIGYVLLPILPDPQDREDCLSEITLRVWEKVETYDPSRGCWRAWLTALARNAALNHARKNRREEVGELTEEVPSREPTPEELVLREESRQALARALESLSSKELDLFYRKYYYLQATAQIAAELGMTERAVEGRLYRIKGRLKKILGGEGFA